jgi:hypothetical protein
MLITLLKAGIGDVVPSACHTRCLTIKTAGVRDMEVTRTPTIVSHHHESLFMKPGRIQ